MVSNELEVNIRGLDAESLLVNKKDIPIESEVNPNHVVELNVSMARNVAELNTRSTDHLSNLTALVDNLGGTLYGGASVFEDVSGIEPARYLTTSLSEQCAHGFLDISSQQLVIGVQGKEFGIKLFNYLRTLDPALVALSASSPLRLNNESGLLELTGSQSRRLSQYSLITANFPKGMLETPELRNLEHYHELMSDFSTEIKTRLANGQLDANLEELTKEREGGAYINFDVLLPHQIYWMTRLRPDQSNSECDFAIEMRSMDMPVDPKGVRALNSLVAGIAYYAAKNGFSELPGVSEEYNNLLLAAAHGFQGVINQVTLGNYVRSLAIFAEAGLRNRGFNKEAKEMNSVINNYLVQGNEARHLRRFENQKPEQAINYLTQRMRNSN